MTGVVPELASLTDEEICLEIAKRLRAERLRKDLSQMAMSKLSGIPLRTYKRLEANGTGSIMTLVAAMRAYDRLLGFHLLLPQPTLVVRKNAILDIKQRKRARKGSFKKPPENGSRTAFIDREKEYQE